MMRAMCGVKLIEKRRNQKLAKASGIRWYGHVLRRDNGDVLKRALDFEVTG